MGTENSYTGKLYRSDFQKYFINNEIIYHRHYSSISTDRDWVESMWDKLQLKYDINNSLKSTNNILPENKYN